VGPGMRIHDWAWVNAGVCHHFHHGWIDEIARALNPGLLPPHYYALAERNAEHRVMPIHDWTRVDAGIFHDFHLSWLAELKRALNAGLLPQGYYALAEQIAGGLGPDVLTLALPTNGVCLPAPEPTGGVAVATNPPRAQYRLRADPNGYAARAKAVVIRHASNHKVIAVIEIVSPGNKNNRSGLRAFVRKAVELLQAGIHLLVIDLFPPGSRDPHGLPRAIWGEYFGECEFALTADRPLTLSAYVAGPVPELLIEPTAVGVELIDMPLFLDPETYVPVPREATYQAAWESVPAYWREVIAGRTTHNPPSS
jgi:hypothetical protein